MTVLILVLILVGPSDDFHNPLTDFRGLPFIGEFLGGRGVAGLDGLGGFADGRSLNLYSGVDHSYSVSGVDDGDLFVEGVEVFFAHFGEFLTLFRVTDKHINAVAVEALTGEFFEVSVIVGDAVDPMVLTRPKFPRRQPALAAVFLVFLERPDDGPVGGRHIAVNAKRVVLRTGFERLFVPLLDFLSHGLMLHGGSIPCQESRK